ncbi:phage tail tape measure protein [uncultured Sphingomonas sp.]|uniref:phage tail tape measure protein n=1 Tax=uncultured Sphingomonas sp. TaxID=158754 RepID=UPI0025E0999E|nr:phage tail tape measure protein [uncultured Sphingomonas sp.]
MDRNLRIRMLLEAGDKATRPLRDIAGASGKAAQGLKATRDRLKEIERAQADVAGFRQLKTGLRSTEQDLTRAQSKVATLARAMSETSAPTKAMARDFARARTEAQKLEQQHTRETQELQQLRDRLRAAGIATTDLARHERELRRDVDATNREIAEQERRLHQATERARRFGAAREGFTRTQGIATGMAASGAAAIGTGAAMGAPIVAAVSAAEQFESTMTEIGQKADLSRQASAALGVNLLKAAQAANQMPADLQAGVDTLAGLGAKVPDAVAMMTPIGRAATAYKAEIADLSAASFAATDNLKVPVKETGRIIDIMATAGKAGAFEIKDMAQYFPALTAAYQGLGQTGAASVADLAAGLQIVRKGAGDSATAGTNLSNILQKIASPATNKAFEKMGVDLPAALKKAYAEGKTPLEAIAELTNKTLKGDLSKLGYLFEDAQVQQGLRPMIQNMQEFRRIRAEAMGGAGATDRDFAERMRDSAERTKALQIRAMALKVSLGSQLMPTIDAGKAKVMAFAEWISGAAQRHPLLTKAVMVGAATLAALFVVLGGGAIVIAGLVAPFAALSFAAGALGIAVLPLVGITAGVILGLIALTAASYALYANWGTIWPAMKAAWFSFWGGLQQGFAAAGSFITRWAPWVGSQLMNGLLSMLNPMTLVRRVKSLAFSAIGAFKSALGIHSPSRVFAGLGGFMMTGLANGIQVGAAEPMRHLDTLTRDMEQQMVVGSALPGFTETGPRAAGAGSRGRATAPAPPGMTIGTVTITVVQQPGESGTDLADRVHDRLVNAGRSNGYGDRADYGDT